MNKLDVQFCGFKCANPFFLAASPVARNAEMIMRAFDCGWGGAVTKSLSLNQDNHLRSVTPRFSQCLAGMGNIDFRIDRNVNETIKDWSKIKRSYPGHFLAVSIKEGSDEKTWRLLASMAESTGADAIELCLSCPDMACHGSRISVGQSPDSTYQVIDWVKKETSLPLIIKLTPAVADIYPVAKAVSSAGAAAVTVANTLKSITGINLDNLVPEPNVCDKSNFVGLSGASLKPLTLRLVAELHSFNIEGLSISGAGGVRNWRDAVEYILLGSLTVQVATEVMLRGYRIIEELTDGLKSFMELKGFTRISDFMGLSVKALTPTSSLSQDYRVAAFYDPDKCVGCGRCYSACNDGAYQAIDFDVAQRVPTLREEDCHGCGLCVQVCPVYGCIVMKESNKKFPKK